MHENHSKDRNDIEDDKYMNDDDDADGEPLSCSNCTKFLSLSACSPVRYVLKIHFFIESGRKMIQFKIQFKTKSKIFIQ